MTETGNDLNRAGNRCLAKRDFQGALEAFERLTVQAPDSPDGFIGLAKVLARLGEYHSLVERLALVVDRLDSPQLTRLFADALRVLANRGETRFVSSAIEYYRRYHAKRTDQATLFYLGELLVRSGDLVSAAEVLRQSWEQDRRSDEAFSALVNCLQRLGRAEEVGELRRLRTERS